MKDGNITLQGLRGYAEAMNNKTLETAAHHKRFRFSVDHRGFHYTPESSGKPRFQEYRYIDAVIVRFNDTRSLNPKDYQDITRNSSYLLVLIEKYRNA